MNHQISLTDVIIVYNGMSSFYVFFCWIYQRKKNISKSIIMATMTTGKKPLIIQYVVIPHQNSFFQSSLLFS